MGENCMKTTKMLPDILLGMLFIFCCGCVSLQTSGGVGALIQEPITPKDGTAIKERDAEVTAGGGVGVEAAVFPIFVESEFLFFNNDISYNVNTGLYLLFLNPYFHWAILMEDGAQEFGGGLDIKFHGFCLADTLHGMGSIDTRYAYIEERNEHRIMMYYTINWSFRNHCDPCKNPNQ